jgi:hypothetical protein
VLNGPVANDRIQSRPVTQIIPPALNWAKKPANPI